MKEKNTDELLQVLNLTESKQELEDVMKDMPTDPKYQNPITYLEDLLEERSISKSQVIRDSGLSRTYGYQIFQGVRQPSRDKLLLLAIAAKLTLREVQQLLAIASAGTLYPKKKRDFILIFALKKRLNVIETNTLLYDMEEPILE